MFILIVILIALFIFLSLKLFRGFAKLQRMKIPDHRFTRYPIFIDMMYALYKLGISSPEERFTAMANLCFQYPDMMKLWFGPKLVVFVNNPQRIQKVLLSQKCAEKWDMFYSFMERENGLIAARVSLKWKEHRKFFNCCFGLSTIESFVPMFAECSEDMCNSLEKQGQEPFDFLPFAKKYCFNVVCATSLDMKARDVFDESLFGKIFDAFELTETALNCKLEIPFLYPSTIYKLTKLRRNEKNAQDILNDFRDYIMDKRREIISNNDIKDNVKTVLVDHIIQNEETFTRKEILDHVLTFIAGYETISNALAHVILLLAMHPEIQENLHDAIQKTILSDVDINDSVLINSIQYLEFVLRESYRLMPTVPMILREVSDNFEMEPNLIIPKGIHLVINFYALHRRKDIWGSDANEFNPKRFSMENSDDRHLFSFLPFSAGSRICIANKYSNISIKVALVDLLRKFRFQTTMKMEDIKLKSYVSLKLCTEHLISLERRCN